MRARAAVPTLLAACLTLACLATPRRASACWDGYAASAGNVHVAVDTGEGSPSWSPPFVRDVATWLVRTDALLPAGVTVDVDPYGYGSVCRGTAADACATEIASFRWDGDMQSLFRTVAAGVHASPASRRGARARRVTAWSVQVFAARDERRAQRVADELNALQKSDDDFSCDEGFLSVGGFPSWNDCAHVAVGEVRARDGRPLHRVLVGAFLDPAEARAALAQIVTHTSLRGFVRTI